MPIERYEFHFEAVFEVTDETALREAAFHDTRRIMADPKTLGIAVSGGMQPHEAAGADVQGALLRLARSALASIPGVFMSDGGGGVGRLPDAP